MTKSTPLVSAIIVTYNTRDLVAKSLKSVYGSRGFLNGEIEVIVVDNHSSDDTVTYVKRNFPAVRLIENSDNKGFGGGNNQGARIAMGKYLLLLNTDAFLETNSLRVLVDILESHTDISSVAPQLRSPDGSVQLSAGYLPTLWRVKGWLLGIDVVLNKIPLVGGATTMYHMRSRSWYTKSHEPEWLMGACVLFRRDEFLGVGGFDEKMFMYAEEVELYLRMKKKTGKNNYFTVDTWVTHVGSASTKKAGASRLIYELQGIEYIYKKHYPRLLGLIRIVIYTGVMMRVIAFSVLGDRKESLEEYKNFLRKI